MVALEGVVGWLGRWGEGWKAWGLRRRGEEAHVEGMGWLVWKARVVVVRG